MKRPADAYWFNLKDKARRRGRGTCEWCQLRPVADLHHRTYDREGQERPEDVMAVCIACHETIHGLRGARVGSDGQLIGLSVKVGSLADLGDCGFNDCYRRPCCKEIWKTYIEQHAESGARPCAEPGPYVR